jgi:ubiquinol-cytochrome c reductase iron-sulfur subunit
VNVSAIQPAQIETVEWRSQPVFVLPWSATMLDALKRHDDLLAAPGSRRSDQPAYTVSADRSIKPEILAMVGICTHLGCIPTFRPTPGPADIGASWPGGFYCPGHGMKFDLAGRVFKNVPAPTNLVVPPCHIASDSRLLIGVDPTS